MEDCNCTRPIYVVLSKECILILGCMLLLLKQQQSNIQDRSQMVAMQPPEILLKDDVAKNLGAGTHTVIGGCRRPCSTRQPRSFSWISLPLPCHSNDPQIYAGCVACYTRCGPALDPCPQSGGETLCVCGHCCCGSRLCGYVRGVGHSGPRVHVNNLPLAPHRQSLGSPGFQSQTSLAQRGRDLSHCGGFGVQLRRKNDAGIS